MRCVLKSSLRCSHHCPRWRSHRCELDPLGFLPQTTEIPNHLRVLDEELLHKLFNSSVGEGLPSEVPASVYSCAQRRKLPSCDFFHTCLNQVSLKMSVWFPTCLKRCYRQCSRENSNVISQPEVSIGIRCSLSDLRPRSPPPFTLIAFLSALPLDILDGAGLEIVSMMAL